ncbi:MAG TPA: hypothetical protein VFD03_06755 [Clostridia bacterium]|nr:hypothetical protein [Clostridia bacterium]
MLFRRKMRNMIIIMAIAKSDCSGGMHSGIRFLWERLQDYPSLL